MGKTIAAAAFQAKCLRIINEMGEDGEPVTITNRGRPVALLSPVRPSARSDPPRRHEGIGAGL